MKKLILLLTLFVTSITIAQNSLFDNISTKDQYTGYSSIVDNDNDGVYEIRKRQYVVKFKVKTLATGEGYSISAIVDKGSKKGKTSTIDVIEGNFTCKGYPFESVIRNKGEGVVAIGDYVFFLKGISDDGTSYTSIDEVYIKDGASAVGNAKKEGKKKKKKKISFKDRLKQLKSGGIALKANYGSEHKTLQSQNLRKKITDYLVAMKAKQDARTTEQKKSDKNILKSKEAIASKAKEAKAAEKSKRDAEWAEAKRYNDSVKATPEHQDLQRRKAQNERNYQSAQKRDVVTLRNNSSRTIYVGTHLSVNRGTEIPAGKTAKWSCSQDAFIQNHTIEGGSNAYRSTKTKVYSANTGCGSTKSIN